MPLRFLSYLAPGVPERVFRALASHLSRTLGDDVQLVLDTTTSGPGPGEIEPFASGGIDIAALCSTSYVWLTDADATVELAGAAWVPTDHRSGGRPVFASDLVTAHGGPLAVEELRGTTVAYNDRSSLSGRYALEFALVEAGIGVDQVTWVRSGSHAASLEMVAGGAAAAAAIDGNVLRRLTRSGELPARVGRVARLGTFPSQPIVVRADLSPGLRARILVALLRASAAAEVSEALWEAELRGFAPVTDRNYAPLRARLAEHAAAIAGPRSGSRVLSRPTA